MEYFSLLTIAWTNDNTNPLLLYGKNILLEVVLINAGNIEIQTSLIWWLTNTNNSIKKLRNAYSINIIFVFI